MAGYVTAILAFVRAEIRAQEVSNFCDILFLMTSCDFTAFYSFLTQANVCFVRCAW